MIDLYNKKINEDDNINVDKQDEYLSDDFT